MVERATERPTVRANSWVAAAALALPVHRIFESCVLEAPSAIALVMGERRVSYGQLNARANRLASELRGHGVGPEVKVGVAMERSVEMVVAILATLKAGGAYVPLDARYPAERLAFMIADAELRLVLADRVCAPSLADRGARVLIPDDDEGSLAGNLDVEVGGESLCYVMYTSGSTGRPKGAEILHRGVVRLVRSVTYVDLGPDEVILHAAPISFDASTFELWGALLNGATVAMLPPGPPTLEEIGRTIRAQGVTTAWLTAGLFNVMVDERISELSGLRQLLIGGEALSVPHVRRFLAEARGTRLINGYGPTETTTFACCHQIKGLDPEATSVPIGRPIDQTYVHLLDAEMHPTEAGLVGELYIGGMGLARGYLNLPEATAERFIRDPFSHDSGARVYRTGDLVRRLEGGALEFIGRVDDQVKIRGYRIELGEIEAVLRAVAGVREAAVLVREDASGVKRLVAYVVQCEGGVFSGGALRAQLGQKLPEYMIPAVFAPLDRMPLTPNGKLDRRALPDHELGRDESTKVSAAPDRTSITSNRPSVRSSRASTPSELRLAGIWENVLGVRDIDTNVDFFDIAGDSIQAIRIFDQIQRNFGVSLPIDSLLRAPTLGQLAQVLEDEGTSTKEHWPTLVPIQPRGARPAVFFVHTLGGGGGGGLLRYRKVAERLGPDQPSFGIEAPSVPFSDLVPMAEHYIKVMRGAQPEGPYRLAGFSFGGNVAYEMAQQLYGMGQEVSLVALLGADLPVRTMPPVPALEALRLAAVNVPGWIVMLRARPLGEQLLRAGGRLKAKAVSLMNRSSGSAPGDSRRKLSDYLDMALYPADYVVFAETHYNAYLKYKAMPYPGHITLIRTRAQRVFNLDQTLGWGSLALGGISVHTVSGTHEEMLEEPHVDAVAGFLRAHLDRERIARVRARRG